MPSRILKTPNVSQKVIQWGLLLIIGIMPFHAFISVFLGSIFGHQTLIQAWKDILTAFLVLITSIIVWQSPELRRKITTPTSLTIVAFVGLSLLVSLATINLTTPSFWYGVKVDLEFLLLFVVAQLALNHKTETWAIRLIVISSTLVALFATLQATILDKNFLTHFGFGTHTLPPYQLIDPALPLNIRVIGTLAGPNQLGSFLILPICLMTYLIIKKHRFVMFLPLAACFFALIHSYSRSAWIGAIVSLAFTLMLSLPRKAAIAICMGGLIFLLVMFGYRQKLMNRYPKLQYFLLHSQSTGSAFKSSNDGHLLSLEQGISGIKAHPLGGGLGSAGPASFKSSSTLITENYYLQIAVETGLLGLALFLAITGLLAKDLLAGRHHSLLAAPCLAALAGLSVINLFLHGWADSSTALIFWGTAGATVATIKGKHNNV